MSVASGSIGTIETLYSVDHFARGVPRERRVLANPLGRS
jgi:hypothetical protein